MPDSHLVRELSDAVQKIRLDFKTSSTNKIRLCYHCVREHLIEIAHKEWSLKCGGHEENLHLGVFDSELSDNQESEFGRYASLVNFVQNDVRERLYHFWIVQQHL